MKKVLSLVLVLALVLGSFSFAFAFDDVAGENCEDAVNTLVALGVINGYDDGTFKPENVVKRAEIAKMLIVALGYEDLVTGTASSFSDCTGHWADKYIAFAAGQELVNGYPDGTFKPDAPVSYDEAITMIVRALGYNDDVLSGTWPSNYKIKALDLDLTDDVNVTSGGADRGGVAMLLFNALEAEIVTINADDEVVYADTDNGEKVITMLDRLGELLDDNDALEVVPEMLDEDSDDYQVSNIDLAEYMYETIEVYTVENEDGDDAVVYVSDRTLAEETVIISGTIDSMTEDYFITIEDADEDTYEFDASDIDKIYFNGAEVVDTDMDDIYDAVENDGLTVTIKAVFTADEDSDYVEEDDIIQDAEAIVLSYATDAVQIEDEYDDDDLEINDIKLPVTEDDDDDEVVDFANLIIEGDATSLEDIQEDDIVTVFSADVKDGYPQVVKLIVTRDTMEGKVQKVKDGNTFVIDGTTIDTSEYEYISDDFTDVALSNEGTFYLDENGEILVFDGDSVLENYAVVIDVENGTIDEEFGDKAVDSPAQIKLATAEGEELVLDLYYDIDDEEGCTLDGEELLDINDDDEDAVTLDVNADLAETLVLYDTNSDGEVDEIELVEVKERDNLEISGSDLGNAFRFTADTIIFDAGDDFAVVDLEDLVEAKFDGFVLVEEEDSTFGNLEVVIVPDGAVDSAADGIYAMILDADDTLDADEEPVQEASLLIDGEEVTYSTDDEGVVDTDEDDEWYFNLYELTIDDEELTKVEDITASDEYNEDAVAGEGNYVIYGDDPKDEALEVQDIDTGDKVIRFNNTNYGLEDDVVVYVANYDTDSWDDVEAGDLKDIDEEDYIKAYNLDFDDDDDEGLDVIIVFTGDVDDYMALEAAKAAVAVAEESKTQVDVDDAQDAINAAPKGDDKDELQDKLDDVQKEIDDAKELLDEAKALEAAITVDDKDDYKEASWNAYLEAIEDALDLDEESADEMNAKATAINAAIEALEPVEAGPIGD